MATGEPGTPREPRRAVHVQRGSPASVAALLRRRLRFAIFSPTSFVHGVKVAPERISRAPTVGEPSSFGKQGFSKPVTAAKSRRPENVFNGYRESRP